MNTEDDRKPRTRSVDAAPRYSLRSRSKDTQLKDEVPNVRATTPRKASKESTAKETPVKAAGSLKSRNTTPRKNVKNLTDADTIVKTTTPRKTSNDFSSNETLLKTEFLPNTRRTTPRKNPRHLVDVNLSVVSRISSDVKVTTPQKERELSKSSITFDGDAVSEKELVKNEVSSNTKATTQSNVNEQTEKGTSTKREAIDELKARFTPRRSQRRLSNAALTTDVTPQKISKQLFVSKRQVLVDCNSTLSDAKHCITFIEKNVNMDDKEGIIKYPLTDENHDNLAGMKLGIFNELKICGTLTHPEGSCKEIQDTLVADNSFTARKIDHDLENSASDLLVNSNNTDGSERVIQIGTCGSEVSLALQSTDMQNEDPNKNMNVLSNINSQNQNEQIGSVKMNSTDITNSHTDNLKLPSVGSPSELNVNVCTLASNDDVKNSTYACLENDLSNTVVVEVSDLKPEDNDSLQLEHIVNTSGDSSETSKQSLSDDSEKNDSSMNADVSDISSYSITDEESDHESLINKKLSVILEESSDNLMAKDTNTLNEVNNGQQGNDSVVVLPTDQTKGIVSVDNSVEARFENLIVAVNNEMQSNTEDYVKHNVLQNEDRCGEIKFPSKSKEENISTVEIISANSLISDQEFTIVTEKNVLSEENEFPIEPKEPKNISVSEISTNSQISKCQDLPEDMSVTENNETQNNSEDYDSCSVLYNEGRNKENELLVEPENKNISVVEVEVPSNSPNSTEDKSVVKKNEIHNNFEVCDKCNVIHNVNKGRENKYPAEPKEDKNITAEISINSPILERQDLTEDMSAIVNNDKQNNSEDYDKYSMIYNEDRSEENKFSAKTEEDKNISVAEVSKNSPILECPDWIEDISVIENNEIQNISEDYYKYSVLHNEDNSEENKLPAESTVEETTIKIALVNSEYPDLTNDMPVTENYETYDSAEDFDKFNVLHKENTFSTESNEVENIEIGEIILTNSPISEGQDLQEDLSSTAKNEMQSRAVHDKFNVLYEEDISKENEFPVELSKENNTVIIKDLTISPVSEYPNFKDLSVIENKEMKMNEDKSSVKILANSDDNENQCLNVCGEKDSLVDEKLDSCNQLSLEQTAADNKLMKTIFSDTSISDFVNAEECDEYNYRSYNKKPKLVENGEFEATKFSKDNEDTILCKGSENQIDSKLYKTTQGYIFNIDEELKSIEPSQNLFSNKRPHPNIENEITVNKMRKPINCTSSDSSSIIETFKEKQKLNKEDKTVAADLFENRVSNVVPKSLKNCSINFVYRRFLQPHKLQSYKLHSTANWYIRKYCIARMNLLKKSINKKDFTADNNVNLVNQNNKSNTSEYALLKNNIYVDSNCAVTHINKLTNDKQPEKRLFSINSKCDVSADSSRYHTEDGSDLKYSQKESVDEIKVLKELDSSRKLKLSVQTNKVPKSVDNVLSNEIRNEEFERLKVDKSIQLPDSMDSSLKLPKLKSKLVVKRSRFATKNFKVLTLIRKFALDKGNKLSSDLQITKIHPEKGQMADVNIHMRSKKLRKLPDSLLEELDAKEALNTEADSTISSDHDQSREKKKSSHKLKQLNENAIETDATKFKGYAPLASFGGTQFAVANLGECSVLRKEAYSFRQDKLYGSRIPRVPSSTLKTQKRKREVYGINRCTQ